ncbi:MAG: hypothetical protein IJ753_04660 [Bacteroidales bacterium]|nr:hypothetical protein [Bacteroidales bacterium]
MKKTMIVLSALIALVACNKVETEQPTAKEYTYDITITRADDTKAVKADWENGDAVYVFFSNVAAPKYLKFTYDGSAWTRTQYNGATAESFTYPGNGNMTAIYLPYSNDAVVSADGTSFKFDKSYTSYYLKAEKTPYTVSGTVVSGTLSMEAPEGFVQFAMPLSGTTTFFRNNCTYTLSGNNLKPVSFASVSSDGTVNQDETAAVGAPITGYIYGGDINFSGVLSATANGTAADYAFTFVNNNGTAGTYDDVTYLLSGNKTLSYKAAIKFPAISSSAWKVPAPSYVEINGVKWATCNIGANTPGGYGDYFAWGATYPQAKYEESDYRESSISANLTPANDVASQKLGSEWHMPTETDIKSIYDASNWAPADGVTWTWISNTATYGTKGYEVYLTSDPSKKIFLPAAGCWSFRLNDAGSDGDYWSSEYNTYEYAWRLDFNSSNQNKGNGLRKYGQSVRPVHN